MSITKNEVVILGGKTMSNNVKHLIFSNFDSNCHEDCDSGPGCDCDEMCLNDEHLNLNIQTEGNILAIVDVGRWNGRFTACKEYSNNISSILTPECEYVKWYSDGRNIKATMAHHDGRNYYEYREIRPGRKIQNLTDKIQNGEPVTRQMINYYTKSIHPYIAAVYGW